MLFFNALKQENIGRLFYSYKNINKIYYLNAPDFIIDYTIDCKNMLLYLEVCKLPLNKDKTINFKLAKKNIINHLRQAFSSKNGINTKLNSTKTYSKHVYAIFPYKQTKSTCKPQIMYLNKIEISDYEIKYHSATKNFFKKNQNIKVSKIQNGFLLNDKWIFTFNVT